MKSMSSIQQYSLNAYLDVPGNAVGFETTSANKIDLNTCLQGTYYMPLGKTDKNLKVNYIHN